MKSSEPCWVSQELAEGDSSDPLTRRRQKQKDFLENFTVVSFRK